MPKYYLILGLLTLVITTSGHGQSTKSTQAMYVANEFRTYLQQQRLDKHLIYQNFTEKEGFAEMTLKVRNLETYTQFDSTFKLIYQIGFVQFINDKLNFILDRRDNNTAVRLIGANCVIFGMYDENYSYQTKVFMKMGDGIKGKVEIPLTGLTIAKGSEKTPKASAIKAKLSAEIKNYIIKQSKDKTQIKYEIINELGNNLTIDIKNAKNIILDNGTFERIRLVFTIEENNTDLTFNYILFGKYAGGLLWTPQTSRYRDMEPKFIRELQDFSTIIGTILYKTLAN